MEEQIGSGFYANWHKEQQEKDKKRAKPVLPSHYLAEVTEALNVMMIEAMEHIIAQEQQLVLQQQAADVLEDRLTELKKENARMRELLERWAVWTPVASDDQGNFCALCGGEEVQEESPDPFKHTERCPVRPTRAFLAEQPDLEEGVSE
jgi:hypothetical protein